MELEKLNILSAGLRYDEAPRIEAHALKARYFAVSFSCPSDSIEDGE
jgi:hypothetical protein